ncbi:hypothetical protein [Paracoccus denitrificans]|jgi:hypothetical protein|uniref:Uncharacterized protein n=1 Tax=Paracoccus denitrificans (strain Pd 1222) TaxID=318586 RepID=A1B8E4_PARDP|nr:hypothetical protein [Paracoccus denitrificans]ABL71788.1 conserved hypothetical protein [Paracoccus denitrificans PD1222]MBB4628114.1 hypothetical protein [Paracoccus denitrificans]MCU7429179.1 hypothetical protein [Paracoccus denitrificans]QAR28375.1 hypothetical protein EO213_18900 [Paracoccus denitrificans]UPV96509.1 hypothetical protein M0K93_18985 [Paracoccus denitrificans]
MQVVFHCGVHGTDLYRMVKTLLQNRDWLLRNGVEPVTPNRHHEVFNEALSALRGGPATPEMEQVMLDAILNSDNPRRVICSTPTFLGKASRAISPEGLYAAAGEKMAALANLFPSAEVEFFLGLKNPATLVSFILSQEGSGSYAELMAGVDPEALRWGPAIRRILAALPGRRLVVWCHEDTSLIWPEVVRSISTMPADVPLKAGLQILGDILHPDGIRMIREAMAQEERLTVASRRRIFAAALEKHAQPEQIEVELNLPGWTQQMVDRITAAYDADMAEIAALPGVEFLTP